MYQYTLAARRRLLVLHVWSRAPVSACLSCTARGAAQDIATGTCWYCVAYAVSIWCIGTQRTAALPSAGVGGLLTALLRLRLGSGCIRVYTRGTHSHRYVVTLCLLRVNYGGSILEIAQALLRVLQ